MYPTLYDAFLDLFGISLPFLKIVMTFGFFVALAFLVANWVMTIELKRKEAEGTLKSVQRKITAPNPVLEYLMSAAMGFVLGWKVIYLAMNFGELSDHPQQFLLSSEGSVGLGIAGALGLILYKYYQLRKIDASSFPKTQEFHPYQMMGNLTLIAAVAGFAGAKLFHHLEHWSEFVADPIKALSEPFSGLTFFGGLICGAAGVLWYASRNGVRWDRMLDVGAPAMMLAYGIGRMGCHTAGDGDWGTTNTSPKPDWLSWLPDWAWAYDYPNNVLGEVLEQPVWPTPMYEVIMALGLFAILWSLRKRIKASGVLFSIYLIFSGVERFLIEKIRVNPDYSQFGLKFTQAELISTLFVVLGIAGILWFTRRAHKAQTAS